MALQYYRERGNGTRHLVIGGRSSFHGATIAAPAFGGNAGRCRPFSAILPPAEHISPCHPYRCRANASCPECDLSCADDLESPIRQVGADNVAAFIAQPVVGATLGAVAAAPGYFQRIRDICDSYAVPFIADEVMTGFGRTRRRWELDHWGVISDLIVCAKGIGGGYAPLGAVLAKPEFVGEVRSRSGSFVIGHTSLGNPMSCAPGAAVLRYTLDNGLIENAATVGQYFKERLFELARRHEIIGDVRGLRLLLGVELVRNRVTKEPFPPARGVARRVANATLERGLCPIRVQAPPTASPGASRQRMPSTTGWSARRGGPRRRGGAGSSGRKRAHCSSLSACRSRPVPIPPFADTL